jgi:hypothetical protein
VGTVDEFTVLRGGRTPERSWTFKQARTELTLIADRFARDFADARSHSPVPPARPFGRPRDADVVLKLE